MSCCSFHFVCNLFSKSKLPSLRSGVSYPFDVNQDGSFLRMFLIFLPENFQDTRKMFFRSFDCWKSREDFNRENRRFGKIIENRVGAEMWNTISCFMSQMFVKVFEHWRECLVPLLRKPSCYQIVAPLI